MNCSSCYDSFPHCFNCLNLGFDAQCASEGRILLFNLLLIMKVLIFYDCECLCMLRCKFLEVGYRPYFEAGDAEAE